MGTKLRIITIAVTGSLLCLPTVDTFSVIPNAKKQRVILTKKNMLRKTIAFDPSAPKKEKTTKEVQELLDVLEARDNGGTKFIVAQVAPSVRYICLLCLYEHRES
jgi:hypothetical protein